MWLFAWFALIAMFVLFALNLAYIYPLLPPDFPSLFLSSLASFAFLA